MMIKNSNYLVLIFILVSFDFASDISKQINRTYKEPGSIESLIISGVEYDELILVQLDLANDSLFNIVHSNIPDLMLRVLYIERQYYEMVNYHFH